MRLTHSHFCGIALATFCCFGQVLAVPNLFRRQASKEPLSSHSASEINLLKLDPIDQLAIFGDSDRSVAKAHEGQECYARIYDQVKAGCARDSDMSPDERMLASVLLTLCDLRTSNQSVPWECSTAHIASEQASAEPCIEALSRSTRYWSSYAGYLREVPRMCFALQRWRDTDLAREMYKAATQEKIAFIRLWRQKAQESAAASDAERLDRQQWLKSLSLVKIQLQDDLQDILTTVRSLVSVHAKNEQGVTRAVESLEISLKQMAVISIQEYKEAVQGYPEQLSLQLRKVVKQEVDYMHDAVEHYLSKAADLLEAELAASTQAMHSAVLNLGSHTDAMGIVLKDQRDLVTELSSASAEMFYLQQLHGEQMTSELDGFRQIQTDLQTIGKGLNATQQTLNTLLKSQGLETSFSLLSGGVFAVERLLHWSLRELERRLGLGVGNMIAWRCFRWLLFFWPATLKLREAIGYSAAILKALLAAFVLLSMLLKTLLQPLSLLARSLHLDLTKKKRGQTTELEEQVDSNDGPARTHVKGEPEMTDPWHAFLRTPASRAQAASRCCTPHEARIASVQHGSFSLRRSRIHCPSAN